MEVLDAVLPFGFDRISNSGYWYSRDVLFKLSFLTQLVDADVRTRDFFRVVLSEVVREASFTRNGEFKRFRMPSSRIPAFHPDVFGMFRAKALRNMDGLRQYNSVALRPKVEVLRTDASVGMSASNIGPESVDMVITSPPYGDSRTTVAYGQFSRWSNEWFGFDNARNLDNILMGGHKYDREIFETESIRSELDSIRESDARRFMEVISFLNDYWLSIRNVAAAVRHGGSESLDGLCRRRRRRREAGGWRRRDAVSRTVGHRHLSAILSVGRAVLADAGERMRVGWHRISVWYNLCSGASCNGSRRSTDKKQI